MNGHEKTQNSQKNFVTRRPPGSAGDSPVDYGAISTVDCDIVVGSAKLRTGDNWFVSVQDIQIDRARNEFSAKSTPDMLLEVPPTTAIGKALLDNRWQLWVLLKCGKKDSIVIWDLLSEQIKTLVPWTTEPLDIGYTMFLSHSKARIVFGGTKSRKFSTSSLPE